MNISSVLTESVTKLVKRNIAQYLLLDDLDSLKISETEVRGLLNYASLLSLSDDRKDVSLAYEICSRLIELFAESEDYILTVADLILSRIGNFPGRTLLRNKFLNSLQPEIPLSLAFERLARETENSVDGTNILTDFQYKLFESLRTEKSLSVSAPTSAGKSHVLNLDLIRRLRLEQKSCIVYIVPTRALVSEVVARTRQAIKGIGLEGIFVRTAPFAIKSALDARGVVYVLTQERFLRLLTLPLAELCITSIVIDEAHEIQKGKRGILLQNAVDIAIRKFPDATLLFASPLIRNPSYLLEIFNRSDSGRYFTEQVSPVTQNVILVGEIKRKPRKVLLELAVEGAIFSIGSSTLKFDFRGSKSTQTALFALEICRSGESAIIFSDDASEAEASATVIANHIDHSSVSAELSDFINFVKTEIHAEYPLVGCLEKGVAFHYGNMPSIVRTAVERFFKNGLIRFLCSTSTLLQGVNLPAKHIVIQDPHLGTDAMRRADFRNLAGRAGRLLKEFHGNVWCLRPGVWEVECYQGDNLQEIRAAMDVVMEDGGTLIGAISEGIDVKNLEELGDAAYSRLYHEVKENGAADTFTAYETESNKEVLMSNIAKMGALEIDIPDEILDSHRSLRPDLLQNLLQKFRNMENLENAILINPHEKGGKDRMDFAMSTIYQAFDIVKPDKYFNWISTTAHYWAWGKPVGEMLGERVNYARRNEPGAKASPLIRDLLKLIETEIRYKLVKYFAAYEDLLRLAWLEKGVSDVSIAPYHVYLEFGCSDSISLNLMTVGLSRFTALKLKKVMAWSDEMAPEDYLERINKLGINNLPIPRLCKLELFDLIGSDN